MKSLALLFAAMTAAAMAVPSPANAQASSSQTWPNKPIRVITANSAGGTSDIFVARLATSCRSGSASRSSWRTAPAAA